MYKFVPQRACRSLSNNTIGKNLLIDANKFLGELLKSGKTDEARKVFDEMPERDAFTWNTMITGYASSGRPIEARLLFDNAPIKNAITWSSLVSGYCKMGCEIESFQLFYEMQHAGYKPSQFTLGSILRLCSQNGDAGGAIQCFARMRAEGIEANQYTFPAVLSSCASLSDLVFGNQVHGCVLRGGFSANVFVQSALVDMYTKCRDLTSAWKVIESMEVDVVISWNAMIVGCVRQSQPEQALTLFKMMHAKNMDLDEFTFPSVLNSVAMIKDVRNGENIHTLVIKSGFESYTLVSNALIDMYAKQNNLGFAFKVFDDLPEKDVISWTSLITGYAHNGSHEEALKLFCKMRMDGTEPDQIVTSSILSSCSELALLDLGQQIHANSIKHGFGTSLSVFNSLVSLYAHCGCLEKAEKVFYSMKTRNVISWTALIVGYAQNGQAIKSLQLYDQMTASGIKPDFITFIGLLFACSHGGFTEQGRFYFDSMVKDHGINPGPDHYACMIDLLGRSGKMNEAEDLLIKMDVGPDATVWKSLLSACRMHGNIDLAEKAANALFELEPRDSVPYVMLSNMYSAIGKWEEAASVRKLMKSRGVIKEPGHSWMEINSKMYKFLSEDRTNCEADLIFLKVDEVLMKIKEAGYVPDMNFALHDINEEGKAYGLAYHSEKLALAFGMLKLPIVAPIRIYKNIRVCGDCHTAMKFVSRVYERYIVLRDSNCFHHFKDGKCSCGDYW